MKYHWNPKNPTAPKKGSPDFSGKWEIYDTVLDKELYSGNFVSCLDWLEESGVSYFINYKTKTFYLNENAYEGE